LLCNLNLNKNEGKWLDRLETARQKVEGKGLSPA